MTDEAARAEDVGRVLALHGVGRDELADAQKADGALVRRFIPRLGDEASFVDAAFVRRDPLMDGAAHFSDHYLSADGSVHVIVTVMEFADCAGAVNELIFRLMHSMAPGLPRCAWRGGDMMPALCFCAGGEPISAVFFIHANVFVEIRSAGREIVSVTRFATAVAAQLGVEPPPSSEG